MRAHPRIARPRSAVVLLAFAALSISLTGCFTPRNPPCAFTCVSSGNLCPDGYACGTDGLCHRAGADDVCGFTSPYDAGSDGDGATPGSD
jgi:hypothetical protein